MPQRIALAMIVRNEAANIERCIRSAAPFVSDVVIVDTGSTDDTEARATAAVAAFPHLLRARGFRYADRHWVDFSTNRNQALDLARERGADYILTLDADEELVAPEGATLFPALEADSYALPLHMSAKTWFRRVLIKASVPWRYEGEIHEHVVARGPDGAELETACGGIDGFGIKNDRAGETFQDRVEKAKRYARVLRGMVKKNPRDARAWWYLGEALAAAQEPHKALKAYARRVELADVGFSEEVFHALYQTAALREYLGHHPDDVIAAYQRAYESRPTRAEPLWAIAVLYNETGRPALAEIFARKACSLPRPSDSLTVYDCVYAWMAADELAGALGRLGRFREAASLLKRLLGMPQLPEEQRPHVQANIDYLESRAA